MITGIDVSKIAGVSTSTVSKVINHDISISDETRKKVLTAIEELKYIPNESARKLKLGKYKTGAHKELKTQNVGCIVFEGFEKFSHPYFSSILDGIDKELSCQRHYLSFIHKGAQLESDPMLFNRLINSENTDGIIIVHHIAERLLNRIKREIRPIVFVNGSTYCREFDSIDIDREKDTYDAIKYLAGLGHRDIGYVGPFEHGDKRFEGYKKTVAELSLKFDEKIIAGHWNYQIEDGYDGMHRILENSNPLPTAIFAASDQLAIGVMKAIKEKGLRIPEDISVMGYDDIRESVSIEPALTTVRVEKEELGRMAVRKLVEKINNPELMPIKITMASSIVVRNSTKKLLLRKR